MNDALKKFMEDFDAVEDLPLDQKGLGYYVDQSKPKLNFPPDGAWVKVWHNTGHLDQDRPLDIVEGRFFLKFQAIDNGAKQIVWPNVKYWEIANENEFRKG